MSKPPLEIGSNFLEPCLRVQGYSKCNSWDENENLRLKCCNIGCKNMCCVEYTIDKSRGDDLMGFGRQLINTGREFTILTCRCMAPVCYDCIEKHESGSCRICGEKGVYIEPVWKKTIMMGRIFPYYDNINCSQREKWMMAHQDCDWFIEENFPNGDYPDFRDWFFIQTGKRIDIIEMNTDSTCRIVNQYKLQKAKNFLYRQSFFVSSSFQLSQYSPELRFKRLFENSQTLCRFSTMTINSFLNRKERRVYPFLGLTAKVIKILMQKTQKQDGLSLFFMRLIALYFQKRLRF